MVMCFITGTIYAVQSVAARRSKRAGSFGSGCNAAGETCVRIILFCLLLLLMWIRSIKFTSNGN